MDERYQLNRNCSTCGQVEYQNTFGYWLHHTADGTCSAKNPAAVALGRLGGQAKSEAKTAAARENAKKPRGKRVKKQGKY